MADSLLYIINQSKKHSMFFQKIGKKEQKFNLTIKLHKVAYSDTAKSRG